MNITVFDLDKTLINADSGDLFAEYLCQQGLINDMIQFKAKVKYFEQEYMAGRLDFLGYYQFAIEPLTTLKVTELKQLVSRFVVEKIQPVIYKKSVEVINWHGQQTHQLLLISATIELLVQQIGHHLGFKAENILSTQMEVKDGYYTGSITGQPSYEQGKVLRFEQWLQQQKLNRKSCHVTFYSDSVHDLPLLTYVDEPIVVNPDKHLLKHAKEKHWPIIDMNAFSIESFSFQNKKIIL